MVSLKSFIKNILLLSLTLIIISFQNSTAQIINGMVKDAQNLQPLPQASVYIAQTSIGTNTNSDGTFNLNIAGVTKGDVVISSVGYTPKIISIEYILQQSQPNIQITLQPKITQLETVTIQSNKNGFVRWGHIFLSNFLGSNKQAKETVLENPEALRFKHDNVNDILYVHAIKPLRIKNKYLGYLVQYDLEEFVYDFKRNYVSYSYMGYPFFIELNPAKTKKSYVKNKSDTYEGSVMHFFRALYRNRLEQEGFKVYKAYKYENYPKAYIKNIMKSYRDSGNFLDAQQILNGWKQKVPKDSIRYYEQMLQQPDSLFKITSSALTADSIAYAIDSVTGFLNFANYLLITHPNNTFQNSNSSQLVNQLYPSYIKIEAPFEGVYFDNNGYFYHPLSMITEGYWGNQERIATLLPYNYTPPQKKK